MSSESTKPTKPTDATKPIRRDGRRRAPRGSLNRDRVVAAAITLLDREGLDALTVRRLADELDVGTMALYNHVSGKADILTAVTEKLQGDLDLPDRATAGVADLRTIFRRYFRLLVDHPFLLQLEDTMDQVNPAELRLSEVYYSILLRTGLDRRTAVGLLASMLRFTLGCALLYQHRHAWDTDEGYWERVRQALGTVSEADYPTVHTFGTDLPVFSQEDVFEFGLDFFLARLEDQ